MRGEHILMPIPFIKRILAKCEHSEQQQNEHHIWAKRLGIQVKKLLRVLFKFYFQIQSYTNRLIRIDLSTLADLKVAHWSE